MQPYLFPYIGYFQLVAAVDKFVFYDDVNYIKNGWINRNRLVIAGAVRYITVPLSGASPLLKINEVQVQPREKWLGKLLESIRHAYSKAPRYRDVNELIRSILQARFDCISELASHSVIEVSRYLGLGTEFGHSSALYGNADLHGVERVLDICVREGATEYLNLPGGKSLYDAHAFERRGIKLAFIEPNLSPYPRLGAVFEPGLSILDVLMFNEADEARQMLSARAVVQLCEQ